MDEKEFRKKKFSLAGRIFYPKLFTPEAKRNSTRLVYSTMLVWPIGGPQQQKTLNEINAHLTAGKNAFFPTIPVANLQLPVKTWGKYKKKDGSDPAAFLKDMQWMNLSTGEQFKPTVVDQAGQEVIDPQEVYSGRNAVVNLSFYNYSNDNYGFSVNLNAVMLLEGGEKVATGGVDVNDAFKEFMDDTASNVDTSVNSSGEDSLI